MTICVLSKTSVTQAAPSAATGIAQGAQVVNPSAGQSPINPQTQCFHVVATTTSGNVSCTVKLWVSNDGVNWVQYGSDVVIAAGASPQQAAANGSQPWQYYTATVSAISGTGAQVTVTMGS